MATMKAAVIREAGRPKVLRIETLPITNPKAGELLIRIKAPGLNRSELFTRQGHSPGVRLPRVRGIEAVGAVDSCPGYREKITWSVIVLKTRSSSTMSLPEHSLKPVSCCVTISLLYRPLLLTWLSFATTLISPPGLITYIGNPMLGAGTSLLRPMYAIALMPCNLKPTTVCVS
jgi:hypothetical protein